MGACILSCMGWGQARAGAPDVLPAHFQFGLFLALDTRCWPCVGGTPMVVRLLPSGAAINSTPLAPAHLSHFLPASARKGTGSEKAQLLPRRREEADGARESQIR